MKATSVSPTICPECGHRFPPEGPEPARCPDCGCQCTSYGESEEVKEPIPEEMPVTLKERARWKVGFWSFLTIGPLFAAAFMLFQGGILSSQPGFVGASAQSVLLLCLSAAGAGFCLANVRLARQRFADKLAYSFLFGIDVLAAYAGLFLAGAMVIGLITTLTR